MATTTTTITLQTLLRDNSFDLGKAKKADLTHLITLANAVLGADPSSTGVADLRARLALDVIQ